MAWLELVAIPLLLGALALAVSVRASYKHADGHDELITHADIERENRLLRLRVADLERRLGIGADK